MPKVYALNATIYMAFSIWGFLDILGKIGMPLEWQSKVANFGTFGTRFSMLLPN